MSVFKKKYISFLCTYAFSKFVAPTSHQPMKCQIYRMDELREFSYNGERDFKTILCRSNKKLQENCRYIYFLI